MMNVEPIATRQPIWSIGTTRASGWLTCSPTLSRTNLNATAWTVKGEDCERFRDLPLRPAKNLSQRASTYRTIGISHPAATANPVMSRNTW